MKPPRSSRYSSLGLRVMDVVVEVLTEPFTRCVCWSASCFCLTTFDSTDFHMLFVRFAVLGPLLFFLSLLLFLPACLGFALWVFLNTRYTSDIQPFVLHSSPHTTTPLYTTPTPPHTTATPAHTTTHFVKSFTVVSANVLLCPEVVGRFNNCPNASYRLKEIASRLLNQDPNLNKQRNLKGDARRENIIVTQFPSADVLLLQEVVCRWQGRRLAAILAGGGYPHCLYDVGTHSYEVNKFMCGSGLFLASRHPVLVAAFHPYNLYSHYGAFLSLGVLMVKLDLGAIQKRGRTATRGVAYVANTHTQAYEGKRNIVSRQLEEASQAFKKFIHDSFEPASERLLCAVLGGDFNADNISKGDTAVQNLSLWSDFTDPCMAGPGQDRAWAVGTEHRQKQLHHPCLRHPSTFKDIMMDDVLRRHYILDADVESQTLELMRVGPRRDGKGKVEATEWGGRRRIDRLGVMGGGRLKITGYYFMTSLSPLTDHVPVGITLEEMEEEEDLALGSKLEGKKDM